MHELSITRNVVAIVSERALGQRVIRVRLEIGQLSAIMPDAIRFCFDLCAKDTVAEGAALEIDEIPGRGHCGDCDVNVALSAPIGRCPQCGSLSLRLVGGQEMMIKEMEMASCA